MPKRDNFSTLTHIEEAVQRIKRWTGGISREEFLRQSAIMRQLEIIGGSDGPADGGIPPGHAAVLPWNVMKSMRNVLIHGYDEVDIEIVWTTAAEDIPQIHAPLQKLL